MFPKDLAPAWTHLHNELMAACRVLVIHDEPFVGEFLRDTLELKTDVPVFTRHMRMDVLAQAAHSDEFDLILTGRSALEAPRPVLSALAQGKHDWAMVSDALPPALINEAYALGAASVTTHPFELGAFTSSRLTSILQRRTARRLLDLMVRYLKDNVPESATKRVERDLAARSAELAKVLDVAVVENRWSRGDAIAAALSTAGLSTEVHASAEASVEMAISDRGPHVIVISLDHPQAEWLACRLSQQPGGPAILGTVLEDIPRVPWLSGVADVVVGARDGSGALIARATRLSKSGRQAALYSGLINTLFEVARERKPTLVRELVFADSEGGRADTDVFLAF